MAMFKTKPLALGANVFGWTADRDESFAVLDRFVAGGGDLIDTADSYTAWIPGNSGGESEAIIGEWLASRGTRDSVNIATKVAMHPEFEGLAPLNVMRAADASLKRLGVETIDLYYAHKDDPSVPIVETAAAFSELKKQGKIREIGLSNYTPDRIAEWFRVASQEGLELPVALQPLYNMMHRDFETDGLKDISLQTNLAVFPYYSLAKGFLTGKYRTTNDAKAAGASPRATAAVEYLDERGREVLKTLDEIAAAKEASVTAVALAWLKQQPTVQAPIASARNLAQLEALLESLELWLDDAEVQALNAASA